MGLACAFHGLTGECLFPQSVGLDQLPLACLSMRCMQLQGQRQQGDVSPGLQQSEQGVNSSWTAVECCESVSCGSCGCRCKNSHNTLEITRVWYLRCRWSSEEIQRTLTWLLQLQQLHPSPKNINAELLPWRPGLCVAETSADQPEEKPPKMLVSWTWVQLSSAEFQRGPNSSNPRSSQVRRHTNHTDPYSGSAANAINKHVWWTVLTKKSFRCWLPTDPKTFTHSVAIWKEEYLGPKTHAQVGPALPQFYKLSLNIAKT